MLKNAENHINNLDVVRAVAAISVCLYHFGRADSIMTSFLHELLKWGYLGVDAFFVVSGFVIPLALYRSNYRIKFIQNFLLRRFLRLYPAYLSILILATLLLYLSSITPGFNGNQPKFDSIMILCNLTLTCNIFDQNWLSPVFWTLAIEMQYYLLISICAPLIISSDIKLRLFIIILWGLFPLIFTSKCYIFSYTALFGMGILCFYLRESLLEGKSFLLLLLSLFIAQIYYHNWPSAITGLLSTLFISFFPNINVKSILFIGSISYSLYLSHVIIGGRVVNLFERLPDHFYIKLFGLILATLVSIIFASIFYYFIERPSHTFSKNFIIGKSNKEN